ncbi:hypothetical protein EDD85DRAFT_956725 [Armillaria nabsnona]|nr:hypothetical protein EDD85DRAFT_956725 [Armillaria nabsnona]
MSLSHIGCDFERLTHVVEKMSPDGEDKAVLNVQSILAEAYVPPIASSVNHQPLTKAYQSMKIILMEDDKQFTDALRAIDNIETFMARHFTLMDKAMVVSKVGNMPAIRAENCLLSPMSFCMDPGVKPLKEIDAGGILSSIVQKGTHVYTDDNAILFQEWTKAENDSIVSTGTHPGTIKAGDFVNLGASFRIVHYGGKGRIQMRLDSVAVIDRRSGDWTGSIRTGLFYSVHALEPHTVPVAMNQMVTKDKNMERYNVDRWVHNPHRKTYKSVVGRGTVYLYGNVTVELFFCPLQDIRNKKDYQNIHNPYVSALIELEDTWYGNMLVLKMVKDIVVDLEPEAKELKLVREVVSSFCETYISHWKKNKGLITTSSNPVT